MKGQRKNQANSDASLPAEVTPSGGDLRTPAGTVEASMQLQAEILKRLHDQQSLIAEAVKDTRRSEMMINSTRSLNESFTGMKRVQESLLDRLEEGESRRRWPMFVLAALGFIALGGAIVWGVQHIGQTVEKTTDRLAEKQSDDNSVSMAALGEVQAMRERVDSLEARDRSDFLSRLDTLQKRLRTLEEERRELKNERDLARESLGAAKSEIERIRENETSLRLRATRAERDSVRLTKKSLADQQLTAKLNEVIARLRGGKPLPNEVLSALSPGASLLPEVTPSSPAVAAANPSSASATDSGAAPVAGAPGQPTMRLGPDGKPVYTDGAKPSPEGNAETSKIKTFTPSKKKPGASGGNVTPVASTGPANSSRRLMTQVLLQEINALLAQHRGSERYIMTTAASLDRAGIYDVILEVRGQDNSLAKRVFAKKLTVSLMAKNGHVDLDFEDGYNEYRQGLSRTLKSKFYQGKYGIVVPGVPAKSWIDAAFPFLKVK